MANAPQNCNLGATASGTRPLGRGAPRYPNPIPPDSMTPAQRREELCALLAVGLARLAYRVQELAYGGLKPDTLKRLEDLGEQLDGGNIGLRSVRADLKPIAGTRLIREWQGVEHTVTVTLNGFEWQGRPYQSLSAIARAITGSRWNGWVFFGLKHKRRAA